jgi:hypothetical protein
VLGRKKNVENTQNGQEFSARSLVWIVVFVANKKLERKPYLPVPFLVCFAHTSIILAIVRITEGKGEVVDGGRRKPKKED